MKMKRESHGYLILGDKEKSSLWANKRAVSLLNIPDNMLFSCPDFSNEDYDLFGINESRRLKERAFMRPLSGEKKIFIISSSSFTFEAQNALLKLLEEPPLGTHFFIITQDEGQILPTLKSRLIAIKIGNKEPSNEDEEQARTFFSSSPAKRLLTISKMIDKKTKEDMDTFLNNLEVMVSKKIEKKDKTFIQSAESIQKSRQYMNARGTSIKLVFEYLALSLPII